MLYIPRPLHDMPLNRQLCNSDERHQQICEQHRGFLSCRLCGGSAAAGYLAMNCFGLAEPRLRPRPNPRKIELEFEHSSVSHASLWLSPLTRPVFQAGKVIY